MKKEMEKAILTLKSKEIVEVDGSLKLGNDGFLEIRNQLCSFVREEDVFDMLYEGACRLGCNIPEDGYAPRRIQIRNTRIANNYLGIKYADGHKYSDDTSPTEKQLVETVACIQELLDAATKDIKKPFELIIKRS